MFVLGSSLARLGGAWTGWTADEVLEGRLGSAGGTRDRLDGRPMGVQSAFQLVSSWFCCVSSGFCIVDVVFCPFQIYVTCFI